MTTPALASRCDVVIPVKDAVWWVAWCLEELLACTAAPLLGGITVVDDGSAPDGARALEEICERAPRVTLLRNPGRAGFGGACNAGAARGSAKYLLLLNTDCLVSPGTLAKLVAAADRDPQIALACPLSNNSPLLSLPMLPGRSYRELDALLERAAAALPPSERAVEACTVVGNCLLVRRSAWEALGGFDPVWGAGYGEETDLQLRALARGWRGVGLVDTYVYHQGNASFRLDDALAGLAERNHRLFLERWGAAYAELAKRCAGRGPVEVAQRALGKLLAAEDGQLRPELLFVLPTLAQGIGGVQVVLDLCNDLLRAGVEARCLVLGELPARALASYPEPILFGLLHHSGETALLADRSLRPRWCAATHWSTALPVRALARATGAGALGFVQGFEAYFQNGAARRAVIDGYAAMDRLVTTTGWLEEGVRRLVPDGLAVDRAPLAVDRWLFQPAVRAPGPLRLGCVLRSAQDKGQWILQEALDRLADLPALELTLLLPEGMDLPPAWSARPGTEVLRLPLERARIARALAGCDLFLDASLHEGFGLMPLEAMACGAVVVASDSGGVREYLRDGETGVLVREVNQPQRYADEIAKLAADEGLRARLRASGLAEAARFDSARAVAAWRAVLARPPEIEMAVADRPRWVPLPEGRPCALVRAAGEAPRVIVRGVSGAGPELLLRLEVFCEAATAVQVTGRYTGLGRRGPHGRLAAARAAGHRFADRLGGLWRTPETPGQSAALPAGGGEAYLQLPALLPGEELVLAFPRLAGEVEVRGLELRRAPGDGPLPSRFAAAPAGAGLGVNRLIALRESVLLQGALLALPAIEGRSAVLRIAPLRQEHALRLRAHGEGAVVLQRHDLAAPGGVLWHPLPRGARTVLIAASGGLGASSPELLLLAQPSRWAAASPPTPPEDLVSKA